MDASGNIDASNISGVGIAIGHGASVRIYGDIHYYPITGCKNMKNRQ
jgi:hypothetical protein